MYNHILSIILFTPLVGAILLLFVPKENKDAIRWIANVFGFLGFAVPFSGRFLGGSRFLLRNLRACFERGSAFLAGFFFKQLGKLP